MIAQRPMSKPGKITSRQAEKAVRDYLRPKPYTPAGLKRQRCVHCGAPATEQWSLRPCAVGRAGWYPLCAEHDLDLNQIVMAFLKLPDAEQRLDAYRERIAA